MIWPSRASIIPSLSGIGVPTTTSACDTSRIADTTFLSAPGLSENSSQTTFSRSFTFGRPWVSCVGSWFRKFRSFMDTLLAFLNVSDPVRPRVFVTFLILAANASTPDPAGGK